MYKLKTTRKEIVNKSFNLKYAGYCELQTLLRHHEPVAYTSGRDGWNFDAYDVYGVTICTGYRGMPGERLQYVTEYESQARTIAENYLISWDERQAAIEKLLQEFCINNGGRV